MSIAPLSPKTSKGWMPLASLILASTITYPLPAQAIVINDDGAWCWFQDERAVIHDGKLMVGSVANGSYDVRRRGDIDITTVDLASGQSDRQNLFSQLENDDHDVPALWVRPDGRVHAVFAKHGSESHFYYGTSNVSWTDWGEVKKFTPSDSSAHYLREFAFPRSRERWTRATIQLLSGVRCELQTVVCMVR